MSTMETKKQELRKALPTIQDLLDTWQEKYDEGEENEPEYPSAYDRWFEAQERKQDRIDTLGSIVDAIEDALGNYLEEDPSDESKFNDAYADVLCQCQEYNLQYKGLTKVIRALNSTRQG